MHFFIPISLLLAVLSATPTLAGQPVQAIWMGTNFNTVSGPGGSGTANHDSAFRLIDKDGKDIYNSNYPDGYVPCAHVGQEFRLDGGCLKDAVYSFRCSAGPTGIPKKCEVLNGRRGSLGKGEGDSGVEFFGLGIADGGACAVSFELADGVECGEQGGLTGHHAKY
ncbi:hypothetical protein BJY04DRAFT_222490 [Aspergillus karnatakaensis]|uniref:uncharacterized protein n=1 Tax=Aspergillus karnatakaensis TaxID=1810916 RepID=UPI003CCD529D